MGRSRREWEEMVVVGEKVLGDERAGAVSDRIGVRKEQAWVEGRASERRKRLRRKEQVEKEEAGGEGRSRLRRNSI